MSKKYFFLSGLPRAGSTLLSSILGQNPNMHTEGNSALCQFMWDTWVSATGKSTEQLTANKKQYIIKDIISSLPDIYYSNTTKPFVLDKCRTWTVPANMKLIKDYITPNPKIIVLIRPLEEVLSSFVRLYEKNNRTDYDVNNFLLRLTDPIMRPYEGVKIANSENNGEFLFITYNDLIEKTELILKDIYNFFEIDQYQHNLNNIITKFPEDDTVYNLEGMHYVRPTINREIYSVDIPEYIIKYCKRLNKDIGL